jgi:glycosyltransferase involved in cell wall biosynthesis
MNVFVLPSWYPSAVNAASGLFVREQVMAVAQVRPDITLTVGTWGHLDGALSLRCPATSARALVWRLRQPACRWRVLAANVNQVTSPALSWTLALAGGNVAGLLRASRRNLAEAERRLGAQQLIHAHVGFPAGWVAAQLARERGIPFVITEHMSPFPFAALASNAHAMDRLREAFAGAHAVIAVSPALAEEMRALGMRCTQVTPNLVDLARFAATPPPARGPFTFFSLGGPSEHKGTDVLLRALAEPVLANAEFRVVLGGGADATGYRRLARQLGVASRIEWLGAVAPADVPQHMARCHALVQPSRHESFGVVLVEALASGRPVIATRCGGPESIVNEANGVLVEVGDVPALALAMRSMMEQALRFDPVALHADTERRFSAATVARALAGLYDAAVAPKRS